MLIETLPEYPPHTPQYVVSSVPEAMMIPLGFNTRIVVDVMAPLDSEIDKVKVSPATPPTLSCIG